ncbi:MAG TPA: DUF4920 domain-containing protein [Pyrinomonadaceae bacterium]|nr:DUF4920 domain-containing protein [Pyrinomonadaceae bacterium]
MTKTFFAAIALAASLAAASNAQDHQHQHPTPRRAEEGSGEKMSAAEALKAGGGRIKRGAAVGSSPAVAFADVLKEPAKYAGKAVVVEGVVERVCQAQGCWMQIAPEAGAADSVRVTFDHKFFVPKDADKLKFRAEGTFAVKYLTEDEATHLEKEGARLRRDKDGEATELTFDATGVELWK